MTTATASLALPLPATERVAQTDRDAFVRAMSRAVAGVNVVTSDGPGGRLGLTVSAMTSLSADPPLLLVCIQRRSPLCRVIRANRRFAVNVLAAGQRHVAATFAGHPERGAPYAFAADDWELDHGVSPRLRGAVARFDCALSVVHEHGTHILFIGRVRDAEAPGGTPLLYSQRAYGRPRLWPHAE